MENVRTFINTTCSDYNGSQANHVVVRENNATYHLINEAKASAVAYRYDSCVYQSTGKACDYIITMESNEKESVFLVELKASSQLNDALKQIEDTFDRLIFDNKIERVYGRIVLYSVPASQTSQVIKLDRKFKQKKGSLKVKSGRIFEEIFNNN